ncbi:Flagellar rod assembly protein/muramidase FlgJ [Caenorhabditis elegans]|uniref:Flagellar rod assembly protein/muramidase FlgJ n=1 Tax=Caenorhabditis elegans TaxID=6239 RepID=Q564U8_CAEEL|nr:Flagellar rod assembly protein/muramidase FlgJ [Caenorhabditis elegans]CAI79123.1 Flagellar rod assembly protein/muramidase FlgJ [Caenorhabditis elegans]|eukprot:NP_001023776.1 Uncharacterized protein CELE_F09C6.12 [Caenorhabditis elegans]
MGWAIDAEVDTTVNVGNKNIDKQNLDNNSQDNRQFIRGGYMSTELCKATDEQFKKVLLMKMANSMNGDGKQK